MFHVYRILSLMISLTISSLASSLRLRREELMRLEEGRAGIVVHDIDVG